MAEYAFQSSIEVEGPQFSAVGLSFDFSQSTEDLDPALGPLLHLQKTIVALLKANNTFSVKTTCILSEDIGAFGHMIAKRIGMPGITALVACPRFVRRAGNQWQLGFDVKVTETVPVNREKAGHITAHAAAMLAVAILDNEKVPELGYATIRVTSANRTTGQEENDFVLAYAVTGTVDVMLERKKIKL